MYMPNHKSNRALMTSFSEKTSGYSQLVSEIIYDPQQPFVLYLLLPFLQQLLLQPRWQFWSGPEGRISRRWLAQSGLPEHKIVQAVNMPSEKMLATTIKTLRSGNYSAAVIWTNEVLSQKERKLLEEAAQYGDSYCFIMRSYCDSFPN